MRIVRGNRGLLELDLCHQPKEHGKKRYVLVQPNVREDFLQCILDIYQTLEQVTQILLLLLVKTLVHEHFAL